MDIGKFKASRGRLILWTLIPPALIVGIGLSSFAMKSQSEWRLNRTRLLAEMLPEMVKSQQSAHDILFKFDGAQSTSLKSEDELISYLQGTAAKGEFRVDSLKVDRQASSGGGDVNRLIASVVGSGRFRDVEDFIGDVTSEQHLLNESSVKITEASRVAAKGLCKAEITFELVVFDHLKSRGAF